MATTEKQYQPKPGALYSRVLTSWDPYSEVATNTVVKTGFCDRMWTLLTRKPYGWVMHDNSQPYPLCVVFKAEDMVEVVQKPKQKIVDMGDDMPNWIVNLRSWNETEEEALAQYNQLKAIKVEAGSLRIEIFREYTIK